jgi:hypothetical protein
MFSILPLKDRNYIANYPLVDSKKKIGKTPIIEIS